MTTIKTTISIEGKEVEVADFPINISLAVSDLQDLSKRPAFKTNSIKVPLTETNKAIFKNYQTVGVRNEETLTGKVQKGSMVFSGRVIIGEVEELWGDYYINFQIIGTSFFDVIEGVNIRDLDYSGYDHNKDLLEIFATFEEEAVGSPYLYILPNYGNWHDSSMAAITEMFPAISVKTIIAEIINQNGYNYDFNDSSNNLNETDYIADFSNILIGEAAISKNKFAELNQAFTADGTITTSGSVVSKYITPAGFENTEVYEKQIEETAAITDPQKIVSNGVVTIPTPGAYDFRLKYDGDFSIERNAGIDPFEILSAVVYKVQIKKNGTLIKEDTATVVSVGTYSTVLPAEIIVIEASTGLLHFEAGDEIEFFLIIQGRIRQPHGALGNSITMFQSGAIDFELRRADARRGFDYPVDIVDHIPNWTVKDFLKNYLTLRNLFLIVDEGSKKVRVRQADNYYNDSIISLTGKRLLDKPIQMSKYDKPAKLTFRFAEDNNDFNYIEGDNETSQDFDYSNSDAETLQVKTAYSYTTFPANLRLQQADKQLLIEEGERSNEFRDLKYNFAPRFLKITDIRETITWNIEGLAVNLWPVVEAYTPENFKAAYETRINQMDNSKVLKGEFLVSTSQVQDIISDADSHLLNSKIEFNDMHFRCIDLKYNTQTGTAQLTLIEI